MDSLALLYKSSKLTVFVTGCLRQMIVYQLIINVQVCYLIFCWLLIWDLNRYQYRNIYLAMENFFTDGDQNAPQITEYQPPQVQTSTDPTQPTFTYQTQSTPTTGLDFGGYSEHQQTSTITYNQPAQNDFNDFEEDETTKRIRDQEQRIQNELRQKSQKQWNSKNDRIAQGRRQLAEFQARKEQEKQERAKQNVEKQDKLRQGYTKMKVQQGWYKVISSVNVRQGEHKGKKDINRMREAILHRREDESGR